MSIYIEHSSFLGHMFAACTKDQIDEFIPSKKSFRIHGHSTTVRLEQAFWSVLEEMASEEKISVSQLVEKIHDTCLVANEKNLSSCLRVICLKYLNLQYHRQYHCNKYNFHYHYPLKNPEMGLLLLNR